nr:DUF308 domain-containing protein [Enterococcus durans]
MIWCERIPTLRFSTSSNLHYRRSGYCDQSDCGLHFIGYLITAYLHYWVDKYLEAHKIKNKQVMGIWLGKCIVFLIIALIVLVLPLLLYRSYNHSGLVIIANGLFNCSWLNTKSKGWSLYSVLLLIGGLILLFNPFKSLMFLFQIFGAILIFMGISEIVSFSEYVKCIRRFLKEAKSLLHLSCLKVFC